MNTASLLAAIVFIFAVAIGWIINLVCFLSAVFHGGELTTLFIGRLVGIFVVPLGALLGLFA